VKAAVFEGVSIISLKEVKTPKINAEEILVRVRACGVCATDVKIYKGEKTKWVRIPSILGHEIAGDVIKIGSMVKGINLNEKVVIIPGIPCGKCYACLEGAENLCINRVALGYHYDGGFAEYIKIPKRALLVGNVMKIPDSLSYEEACFVEPLACCLNSLACCLNSLMKKTSLVNSVVLIIGAGPMGLMHIQLARIMGAKKIIVSEPLETRRKLALKIGADIVVDPEKDSLSACILKETDDTGVDIGLVTTPLPEVVNLVLENIKKGGVLNLFAGFSVKSNLTINPNLVHYNGIKIVGSSGYTRKDCQVALSLLSSKKINAKQMISHLFPLDKIKEAIEIVIRKKGIKVIITP